MASINLIKRAYTNLAAGMPVEQIYSKLMESGEGKYNVWLAYCAAQVAIEQNEAIANGLSIAENRKISLLEEEWYARYDLRDDC